MKPAEHSTASCVGGAVYWFLSAPHHFPEQEDLFKDVPQVVIIVETMNYYPLRDGRIKEIKQDIVNSA